MQSILNDLNELFRGKVLLTVRDVASVLGCSRNRVPTDVPMYKVGKSWRITKEELARYIYNLRGKSHENRADKVR